MNYKKMWYQFKKELLIPKNMHVTAERLLRSMEIIEVSEALKPEKIKPDFGTPEDGIQIVFSEEVPEEVKAKIEEIAKKIWGGNNGE